MYPIYWFYNFPIKLYWLMQILGIASALFLLYFRVVKGKFLSKKEAISFILSAGFWGLVGARLFYYLIAKPAVFVTNFKEIFSLSAIYWKGGASSFGGVLGGLGYAIYFSKRNKIKFWKLADFATPSIALALTFFRVGCFLNGCCYGKPTNLFLGVYYTSKYALAPKGIALHPVQLYEAVLTLILFIIFIKRRSKFSGENILSFAIFYNFFRFIIEFFKWSQPLSKLLPLNANQAFSILFLLLAITIKEILLLKKTRP